MQDFNKKNYLLLEKYEHVHARHLRALDRCTAYKQFQFQQACKKLAKACVFPYLEAVANINKVVVKIGKVAKCTK